MRPLQNTHFCPISGSYSIFNPQNTNVFLRLKFLSSLSAGNAQAGLTLNKIEGFSKVSFHYHWCFSLNPYSFIFIE